jgi:antitoxin component YwqK of YwqJK toxin-antitoxin module
MIVLGFLAGFSNSGKEMETTDFKIINSDDKALYFKNRELYLGSLLFTGRIIEVVNGDTVSVKEYSSGKASGQHVTYFPNGKINEVRYYAAGLKTGEHTGWWENGNLRFIYHFSNDEFDGNMKVWNENGMLFNDFNFVNGKEEGLQRAWFPNGDVQANYVARNNRKYGITGVKNCSTENITGSILAKEK